MGVSSDGSGAAVLHEQGIFLKKMNPSGTKWCLIRVKYKEGMYKVAKFYLHHEENEADAMQETILTCYEKLDTLRKPQYFKTWTVRILINKCKNVLRKIFPKPIKWIATRAGL